MASSQTATSNRKRKAGGRQAASRKDSQRQPPGHSGATFVFSVAAVVVGTMLVYFLLRVHADYAVSFQSPVKFQLQWPIVVARRADAQDADLARQDQKHPLTAYQQYACRKFGPACRVALAIQRAENPQGKCELYHYNSDGTLDWGYFQINTVHLQRPGLVLRDLLDCRANIDFAFQLYSEHHSFTPWSTYKDGTYKRFLRE